MQVLMAVQMRDAKPGRENALDLRAQLPLNTALRRKQKSHPVSRHRFACCQRALFHQSQMHAHFERWHVAQLRGGGVEFAAVRNDRAGGHNSVAMGLDRAGSHAAIEADVIGGDD